MSCKSLKCVSKQNLSSFLNNDETCSTKSCSTKSCSKSCTSDSCTSSSSRSTSSHCKIPLKCRTYKDFYGNILIPGPPGQPSSSLANLTAINSEPNDETITGLNNTISFLICNGINISNSSNNTFTFGISGKYLLQYNVCFDTNDFVQTSVYITINGSTNIGVQSVGNAGSNGCSLIQDFVAGDYITLCISALTGITFASLTAIKL